MASSGKARKGGAPPPGGALGQVLTKEYVHQLWDASSMLGEEQREALALLGQHASERRLPEEFRGEDPPPGAAEEAEAEPTGGGGSVADLFRELVEAEAREVEGDLEDVALHHARLQEMLRLADAFLERLGQVDGTLQGLQEQHDAVVHKTHALHTECETLLSEKTEMELLAEGIAERLAHYDELAALQGSLTSPAFKVGGSQFLPLLTRADEAISALSSSSHFSDTSSYLNRFKSLQARAQQLVRQHVQSILLAATEKVQQQLKESQGRSDASLAAYVQYQAVAEPVHALMADIAERSRASADYSALLDDCQQAYFAQRQLLLHEGIAAKLRAAASGGDLQETIRQGCADLCDLCHREYKLYHHFFPAVEGRGGLDGLLAPFCTLLVDAVRPMYLKATAIEALCSLVMILKCEVLEDRIDLRGDSLHAMRPCVAQLLNEVQERLTFRAQIHIRDDIRGFSPSREDLDYPAKLSSAGGASSEEGGEGGGESYKLWCPVLPRTLACLSQLYRTVDTKIFEGLAQDAVSACTDALITCSRAITKQKGQDDGSLFLVMHLLKLREQIVPFDIDFSATEMGLDFADTRTALSKTGSIFKWSADNALWRLARAPPRVYHTLHNSKKDLERELKQACESFIMMCAGQVADPLVSWVRKADSLLPDGAAARGGGAVRGHAFASPDKVKELMGGLKQGVARFNETVAAKMALYLPNPQTRNVLLTPIKANITDAFARLHSYLLSEFQPDEYVAFGVWSPEELTAALNTEASAPNGGARHGAGANGHHSSEPASGHAAMERESSRPLELSGGGWASSQPGSPQKVPHEFGVEVPPNQEGKDGGGGGAHDLQGDGEAGGGAEQRLQEVERERLRLESELEERQRREAQQAEEERRRSEQEHVNLRQHQHQQRQAMLLQMQQRREQGEAHQQAPTESPPSAAPDAAAEHPPAPAQAEQAGGDAPKPAPSVPPHVAEGGASQPAPASEGEAAKKVPLVPGLHRGGGGGGGAGGAPRGPTPPPPPRRGSAWGSASCPHPHPRSRCRSSPSPDCGRRGIQGVWRGTASPWLCL